MVICVSFKKNGQKILKFWKAYDVMSELQQVMGISKGSVRPEGLLPTISVLRPCLIVLCRVWFITGDIGICLQPSSAFWERSQRSGELCALRSVPRVREEPSAGTKDICWRVNSQLLSASSAGLLLCQCFTTAKQGLVL